MKKSEHTQRTASRPQRQPADYKIAIDKEEVNKMPLVTFPGRIFVIDSMDKVNAAVATLRKAPIVGLDTETRPAFKRGEHHTMALLQLSTADVCFLFRTNKLGLPLALRRYMADPECLKVGLSLHDDFNAMRRICPTLKPAGWTEIQSMVGEFNISDLSLQKIYAILFGRKISKGQRLSNWEAAELTQAQQQYAAIDAWSCIRIYDMLTSGNFIPDHSPYKVPITDETANPQPQQQS